MIKKIIWYLFVCSFVLLWSSFVNAWKLQQIWIDQLPSIYNNQFEVWFLKWWAVITNFLWTAKAVLALDSNKLFWWNENWKPYFYWPNWQWFFSMYFSCDDLAVAWSPQNCAWDYITWDFQQIFKWFFSHVKATDYAYYSYESDEWWVNCSYSYQNITVCFSSSEIWKSLCFKRTSCYNGCQNWSSSCQNFCFSEGGCGGGLVNSNWYTNLTFWSISPLWLSYAPWQAWYGGGWNIEGWSSVSDNVGMTWNLVYNKCTNWYVLNQIDYIYWRKSFRDWCHAWINDTWYILWYDTWSYVVYPWHWIDYKYVYKNTKDWLSWDNWFNSNLDIMKRYKLWSFWPANPFIWKPLYLYTYFENLYENWVLPNDNFITSYDILNYCNLYLYSNYEEEYKWTYFKSYCDNLNYNNWSSSVTTWEIGDIDSDEILPPWYDDWSDWDVTTSWTVVSVNWNWTLSGDNNKNFDWKTFINDIYQKLQANYIKPNVWIVGIIPTYILVFMLALILFRFLQH